MTLEANARETARKLTKVQIAWLCGSYVGFPADDQSLVAYPITERGESQAMRAALRLGVIEVTPDRLISLTALGGAVGAYLCERRATP